MVTAIWMLMRIHEPTTREQKRSSSSLSKSKGERREVGIGLPLKLLAGRRPKAGVAERFWLVLFFGYGPICCGLSRV